MLHHALRLVIPIFLVVCAVNPSSAQTSEDVWRLHKHGQVLLEKASSRGAMEKALEKFEQGLSIAQKVGYKKGEAACLLDIGRIYYHLGQYAKAVEYYDKSLGLLRKLGDVKHEGVILSNIGAVYGKWGQYAKAVEYYDKSLAVATKIGDVRQEGMTLNNIGQVYGNWGQYTRAVEYYDKSLGLVRKLGDVKHEGVILSNIGEVYCQRGQFAKALEYFEKSLGIKRKLGDVMHEGTTLNNIGHVYRNWGHYGKALDYYQKALEHSRQIGNIGKEVRALSSIGSVYFSWGQYSKGLEYLEKSLEITRNSGDVKQEGEILWKMAQVSMAMGNQDQGLADLARTLDIYNRIGVPADGVKDSMAQAYLEKGDIQKAQEFAKWTGTLGWLSLAKSDFPSAKRNYESLLKQGEKNRNADHLFTAYTGLARVYESMEDYKKAEEYYDKAVQFTEELRSGLLPSERKDFFNVKINGFYRSDPGKGLTRVRMKLNQAVGSIDSSELTRARAFSDNLFERLASGMSHLPRNLAEKEDVLLSKVAALKQEIDKTDREKQQGRYENLAKEVKEAEADLNAFTEGLRKSHPAYAAVKYPQPVTLSGSALSPDEYVVMFDVSEEGVGVKLIHGKDIAETHYTKWPLSELEKEVKRFREPFDNTKLELLDPELGHTLYRKLMARVIMDIPKGNPIFIIPDGILGLLPFEALVTSGKGSWVQGEKGGYIDGVVYLGDEHPISYHQSITALSLSRTMGEKTKPSEKLLVVADPVFKLKDPRAQAVRQDRVATRPAELNLSVMKAIEEEIGFSFSQLPETGVMADRLGEMFKPRSLVLTGMKANKDHVLNEVGPHLKDYGRIVFATHGFFSTRIPGLREPFLALTMVPPGTDGFLRMTDVLSLRLNADIVALTACQTALGREVSGEGVMSMGRAFQYAGARSVLMSLWEVEVDSALLLVQTFFHNLKSGKGKLEALTAARHEVRRAGYLHPFFWAPFILVGEPN